MNVCSYCGRDNDSARTTCGECGTRLASAEQGIAPLTRKPEVICPFCGARDNHKIGLALRGSFSWLIYFLGGFIAVLFHNVSREQRVQCNGCGAFFGIRSPISKVSLVIVWLLIAPAIIIVFIILLSDLF